MGRWFDELWNQPRTFQLEEAEEEDPYCPYAREFQLWADELSLRLHRYVTSVSINQAKVLLLDKYMAWRESVPKTHQNYIGAQHICLFEVFDQTYRKLRAAELVLTPPVLFEPPREIVRIEPPPPPPTPQIHGIVIGEPVVSREDDEP